MALLSILTVVLIFITQLYVSTSQQHHTIEIGQRRSESQAWIFENSLSFSELCAFKTIHAPHLNRVPVTFSYWEKFSYGHAPFTIDIEVDKIRNFNFVKNLKSSISSLLGKPVIFQKGTIEYIRAGDEMPITTRFCDRDNSFVLSLFLEQVWRINSYGQVAFYDYFKVKGPDKVVVERMEITSSLAPRPLRAVLWPSCHHVLFRPPGMNHFEPIQVAHLWVTDVNNSSNDRTKEFMKLIASQQLNKRPNFENFQFQHRQPFQNFPFHKHLVKSFYENDIKARHIHVFDNLFTEKELDRWFEHLRDNSRLVFKRFDSSALEDNDNVQWISQFDVEGFLQTGMWPKFQSLFSFISNETTWYPYDIALNVVRSGDTPRIHPDSEKHQTEYTAVLYLSKNLRMEECGSIIFYKNVSNHNLLNRYIEGGDVYDIIGSASPKFGRLVAFINNIEHSAQPPCTGDDVRYSFVVKVARNRRLAFIRRIYEIAESLSNSPIFDEIEGLVDQLQTSLHDNPQLSPLSDQYLENLFFRLKEEQQKMMDEKERELTDLLMTS